MRIATKFVAIYSNATAIFREVPRNFSDFIFYCEEDSGRNPILLSWNGVKAYTETNESESARTLSEVIKTLVAPTNCEDTLRLHVPGHEDIYPRVTAPFSFTFISRLWLQWRPFLKTL